MLHHHPLAALIPEATPEEFEALKASIRANGQREPIVLLDGKILDGRHRERACRELGAKVQAVQFAGSDPVAFVLDMNVHRRHLTESQRAMVAARLATLDQGGEAGVRKTNAPMGALPDQQPPPITQPAAAKRLQVSRRAVQRARVVQSSGAPELAQAVESGAAKVRPAAEIAAALPVEEQAEIVKAGKVTEAAKVVRETKQQARDEGWTPPQTDQEVLRRAREIRKRKTEERREERMERLAETEKGGSPMPSGRTYHVVYCDPPWRYQHAASESRAIENHYPTTSHEDLRAMPVTELAADDAVLVMWATSPKLEEALDLIKAWGFTYKTSMVWVKDRMGMGYYARIRHELLLIATRGKVPAPAPSARPDSIVEAPRGAHSRKPAGVRDQVAAMWPGLRKIELFAREASDGWDVWGFEAPEKVAS